MIYDKGFVFVHGPDRARVTGIVTALKDAVQKQRRDRITQAADFTLRDYWYLMRLEENWAKLAWNVDREYFLDCLDKVVEIRNDLMHFTTDDGDPAQYDAVKGLLEILRTVDPRQ